MRMSKLSRYVWPDQARRVPNVLDDELKPEVKVNCR